jgi:hypothetical protein
MNADVSGNLLLSVFVAKSPLHDGAAVIRANKIVAAGVILPITENPKLSHKYGTRHRAAIGLSEIYDGLCIVVSEETGEISAANRGMLVKYDTADGLADALSYFYYESPVEQKTRSPFQEFISLFGANRGKADTAFGIKLPSLHTPSSTMSVFPSKDSATPTLESKQHHQPHTNGESNQTSIAYETEKSNKNTEELVAEPESTYIEGLRPTQDPA